LTRDSDFELRLCDADEALIKEALREVNALIANEIVANPAYQEAVQSGAVNGYTFPSGEGPALSSVSCSLVFKSGERVYVG
jgi:hypothetical protein